MRAIIISDAIEYKILESSIARVLKNRVESNRVFCPKFAPSSSISSPSSSFDSSIWYIEIMGPCGGLFAPKL